MTGWNPHTWTEVIRRYSGPLTLFAAQWCLDPEDSVQEAFVELFRQPAPPDRLSAWLFTVVKHKSINQRRAEKRRRDHESRRAADGEFWFQESHGTGLDAREAGRLIAALDAEQREVLVARLWGGLAFEEVAQLTGLSKSTCHRRYQDALETLRRQMGASCPNDSK